jgi:hypothetical protein
MAMKWFRKNRTAGNTEALAYVPQEQTNPHGDPPLGTPMHHHISDWGKFEGDTPFRMAYAATPVPTVDNPLRYAYEGMALPGTAPVGRATALRGRRDRAGMPGWLQGAQTWSLQGILISGMPITAGQIVGQPLFDPQAPNGGYVWAPNSGVLQTRNNVV